MMVWLSQVMKFWDLESHCSIQYPTLKRWWANGHACDKPYHIQSLCITYHYNIYIYIPQVIQTNDHPLNQFLIKYPCEPQQHPNRVPTANCSTPLNLHTAACGLWLPHLLALQLSRPNLSSEILYSMGSKCFKLKWFTHALVMDP